MTSGCTGWRLIRICTRGDFIDRSRDAYGTLYPMTGARALIARLAHSQLYTTDSWEKKMRLFSWPINGTRRFT
jgi:hypothetical protein